MWGWEIQICTQILHRGYRSQGTASFAHQHLDNRIRRNDNETKQESCAIAKMTAQCALYMGALKIFGTP